VTGESGTSPVPPGWSLTLTFNGQTVCTSSSIEARCEGEVTFPTVSGETVVPLTATLTSPQGHAIVATRLITVYP
jgi:archaellum component FlaF (FlaF/FlaG flagellin family)